MIDHTANACNSSIFDDRKISTYIYELELDIFSRHADGLAPRYDYYVKGGTLASWIAENILDAVAFGWADLPDTIY